jgi:hypothetical protein
MEYMKDKGDDLETDHKNKDISDCIERCKWVLERLMLPM